MAVSGHGKHFTYSSAVAAAPYGHTALYLAGTGWNGSNMQAVLLKVTP